MPKHHALDEYRRNRLAQGHVEGACSYESLPAPEDAMASPEALVEPALLIWARKSIGLTIDQGAKRVGVRPERIAEWEAGMDRPSVAQLRNIAAAYKRPVALFYLSAPPKGFDPMRDFRRMSPTHQVTFSPDLHINIRDAWERREAVIELFADASEQPQALVLKASSKDDPEEVGRSIREYLGVTDDLQFSWGDERKSLIGWSTMLEKKDILVFQTKGVESEEARGFSISDDILPAIVVNGKDSYAGRVFTMFHELAHILLRTNVLCDLEEEGAMIGGQSAIEIFCNRVSAATLMPKNTLAAQRSVLPKTSRSSWTDTDLSRISRQFGVSREAMLLRLVHIGRASKAFYNRKRDDLQRRSSSTNESRGGPIHPEFMAIKYNGALFARLVLSAYHRGSLTASEVHDHLNLGPKHIEALEISLLKRSA